MKNSLLPYIVSIVLCLSAFGSISLVVVSNNDKIRAQAARITALEGAVRTRNIRLDALERQLEHSTELISQWNRLEALRQMRAMDVIQ